MKVLIKCMTITIFEKTALNNYKRYMLHFPVVVLFIVVILLFRIQRSQKRRDF